MKWFGVDYRYVIAGVGAVFILTYEFVGTQSGEIQPDKQEAQNSKALSVEALNEKLASALRSGRKIQHQRAFKFCCTQGPFFYRRRKEILQNLPARINLC